MDRQLEPFQNASFDAAATANRFFTECADSEVQRKMTELASLQTYAESFLRQIVSEKYSVFVDANSEIRALGNEMSSLKELVTDTLKLVEQVKVSQLQDAKALIKTNDTAIKLNIRPTEPATNKFDNNKMPKWVQTSVEDIDRLIIEHQYPQAVVLINRVQNYCDTVDQNPEDVRGAYGQDHDAVKEITLRVKEKGAVLAQVLKISISRLPNSELWGQSEQNRQLKLLIQLGYRKAAADGFVRTQVDSIRKSLRSVDVSGDPGQYTTELSRIFFITLEGACRGFIDLFSGTGNFKHHPDLSTSVNRDSIKPDLLAHSIAQDHSGSSNLLLVSSDVLAHLVNWIQSQIAIFATVLSRQIQLGASEHALLLFERYADYYQSGKFQSISAGRLGHRASSFGTSDAATFVQRSRRDSGQSLSKPSSSFAGVSSAGSRIPVIKRMSSAAGSALKEAAVGATVILAPNALNNQNNLSFLMKEQDKMKIGLCMGPLTFCSTCLQAVFMESMRLDLLGLEGSASLGWNLLPEIKTLIRNFTNDILDETAVRVQEDSWQPFSDLGILGPSALWPAGVLFNPSTATGKYGSNIRKSLLSVLGHQKSSRTRTNPIEMRDDPILFRLSASYAWIVAVMSEFIAEVWVLLQATSDSHNIQGNKQDRDSAATRAQYYTRDDFCEIEPEIVSCLLRILVRYVRDIQSAIELTDIENLSEEDDINSLSDAQKQCYIDTVEAIYIKLIPNLEDVIKSCFFSDGSILVRHPPQTIFSRLIPKIQEHIETAKLVWKISS